MEAIKQILCTGVTNVLSTYGGSMFIQYIDNSDNSWVYATENKWSEFTQSGIHARGYQCRCNEHGQLMYTYRAKDYITSNPVFANEDLTTGNNINEIKRTPSLRRDRCPGQTLLAQPTDVGDTGAAQTFSLGTEHSKYIRQYFAPQEKKYKKFCPKEGD